MLKTFWRGWLIVAKKIGYFQSGLILTLVYFIVIAPFALAVRLFSDPLRLRRDPFWHRVPPEGHASLDRARQQS